MLIERYRGKTRVMIPTEHPIAVDAKENGNASQLYQWLLANSRTWSYNFNGKRKDDTRVFLSILFGDDADAHLFRLKFQQPGDVTESDGRYTRLDAYRRLITLDEDQLTKADREKEALTFAGQAESKMFWDAERGVGECYSTKRNLAGYFVCWTLYDNDDRDGIDNVSASKTKRIMIERARRRHLA